MDNKKSRLLLAQAALDLTPRNDERVMQAAPAAPPTSTPAAAQPAPMPQMSPADQYFRQGAVALQNYDYPGAAAAWQQALAVDPNHQGARVSLNHIQRVISQHTRTGRSTTEGYR